MVWLLLCSCCSGCAATGVALLQCCCCCLLAIALQQWQSNERPTRCGFLIDDLELVSLQTLGRRNAAAPAVFFRCILSRNGAWLASWLPLDQAPVICVQLAQCSGANCAPQLLVASVSYVDTPLVELHVESSVLATETASTAQQRRTSGAAHCNIGASVALIAARASESRERLACARNS